MVFVGFRISAGRSRSSPHCTNFVIMPHGDTAPQPVAGARSAPADSRQGSARSPGGGIAVRTTERGLPVALKIDPAELKKSSQQLAREILTLCRLSAMRAQVAHRRELTGEGRDAVIRDLRLATEEQLGAAASQAEELFGGEGLPKSWMRSV